AGHAPIIANPEYSEFLRRLGQIGCKAISSTIDDELYEAVKSLTLLKENEEATAKDIASAEKKVVQLQEANQTISEMNAIRNLHWWSVEYGLIGQLDQYRIYGAGLLSSIGESKWCMSEKVKKIPYTIHCAQQNFDYTKPQPQLFVTPDFAHLSLVLEEFANTMAIRCGGKIDIERLINSDKLGTIELSTGVQISGHFSDFISAVNNQVAYFSTCGPTALAYREKELIGHGTLNHPDGFGSPVGKLKGINLAIEDMSPRDLEAYNIYEGKKVKLEFVGGVTVEGDVITGIRNLQGKILLIRFKDCLVQFQDKILFRPDQGVFDMAVGKEIISGFAGPADLNSFDLITHEVKYETKISNENKAQKRKNNLYELSSKAREGHLDKRQMDSAVDQAISEFPETWLLLLQWHEACALKGHKALNRLEAHLRDLMRKRQDISHLIKEGMML
ncbi:MAG: aromatic amino acid hydroxylase, partial [Saprospiraceae bacterium]|nr:aromatic amino acid hydroxylase [Saprospiraceae bacterium]